MGKALSKGKVFKEPTSTPSLPSLSPRARSLPVEGTGRKEEREEKTSTLVPLSSLSPSEGKVLSVRAPASLSFSPPAALSLSQRGDVEINGEKEREKEKETEEKREEEREKQRFHGLGRRKDWITSSSPIDDIVDGVIDSSRRERDDEEERDDDEVEVVEDWCLEGEEGKEREKEEKDGDTDTKGRRKASLHGLKREREKNKEETKTLPKAKKKKKKREKRGVHDWRGEEENEREKKVLPGYDSSSSLSSSTPEDDGSTTKDSSSASHEEEEGELYDWCTSTQEEVVQKIEKEREKEGKGTAEDEGRDEHEREEEDRERDDSDNLKEKGSKELRGKVQEEERERGQMGPVSSSSSSSTSRTQAKPSVTPSSAVFSPISPHRRPVGLTLGTGGGGAGGERVPFPGPLLPPSPLAKGQTSGPPAVSLSHPLSSQTPLIMGMPMGKPPPAIGKPPGRGGERGAGAGGGLLFPPVSYTKNGAIAAISSSSSLSPSPTKGDQPRPFPPPMLQLPHSPKHAGRGADFSLSLSLGNNAEGERREQTKGFTSFPPSSSSPTGASSPLPPGGAGRRAGPGSPLNKPPPQPGEMPLSSSLSPSPLFLLPMSAGPPPYGTSLRGSPTGAGGGGGGRLMVRPPAPSPPPSLHILQASLPSDPSPSPLPSFPEGSLSLSYENHLSLSPAPPSLGGEHNPVLGEAKSPPFPLSSLSLSSSSSPSSSSHIRDTKVVKKKKVELPKGHLPHPKPKFGDWLSSRVMINNYIVLESLGKGSFAEVRLCKEKTSDKLFALKIIDRQNMKSSQLGKKQPKFEDIKREIEIMKQLNHKNVLRLYEVMDDPKVNKLYLVIEYMAHGDLLSMIKGSAEEEREGEGERGAGGKKEKEREGKNKMHPLSDEEIWSLLLQVLDGLRYLHDKKIVHGDIKPQNLLVGEGGVVKIADFGISQTLFASKQKLTDVAGTPAFMSPEMCSGEEYSGQLADIYALGATVYMLRFGSPPFIANSILQLYYKIQNEPLSFPPNTRVDPLLIDLLRGMMEKNPSQRLTLEGVMAHSWVKQRPSPLLDEETSEREEEEEEKNESKNESQERERAEDTAEKEKELTAQEAMQRSVKFISMATHRSIPKERVQRDEEESDSCGEGEEEVTGGAGGEGRERDTESPEKERDVESHSTERERDANCSSVVRVTTQDSPRLQELLSTLQVQQLGEPSAEEGAQEGEKEAEGVRLPFSSLRVSSRELERKQIGICFSSFSIQGQRERQEDRTAIIGDMMKIDLQNGTAPAEELSSLAYFAVFDGHSGDFCSSFLSSHFHEYLVSSSSFPSDTEKALTEACLAIDETICQRMLEKGQDCGSTATIAILDGREREEETSPTLGPGEGDTGEKERKRRRLYVCNVGDSRCILSQKGQALALTSDHRPTREDEAQRVLQEGGWVANDRVNGVMAVSRAFGNLEFKIYGNGKGNFVTAKPEVTVHECTAEDEFFIIACDGLWDVLSPEEAVKFVRGRARRHGRVEQVAKELVEEALRRFSADNVSAVIVFLDGERLGDEGGNVSSFSSSSTTSSLRTGESHSALGISLLQGASLPLPSPIVEGQDAVAPSLPRESAQPASSSSTAGAMQLLSDGK